MTPADFIGLWKDNKLTECGGAQAHFDDLCDLLGVVKPRDPKNYCFERGARRAGGDGWTDCSWICLTTKSSTACWP